MRPALTATEAAFSGDASVVDWLVEVGLLSVRMPAPRGLGGEAESLRQAIEACVRAAVVGRPPPGAAITRIDDWLVLAGSRPWLRAMENGLPALAERAPADSPRRALGMLALDAAELVGRPEDRARLRACDGCSRLFYDRSPAGRRRWCSMQTCGNRAKARRHRTRSAP